VSIGGMPQVKSRSPARASAEVGAPSRRIASEMTGTSMISRRMI
jgi:hypothetical protein